MARQLLCRAGRPVEASFDVLLSGFLRPTVGVRQTLAGGLHGASSSLSTEAASTSYVQGQQVGKRREYYYYIDHNGYLFLDDARMKNFTSCFKGKAP